MATELVPVVNLLNLVSVHLVVMGIKEEFRQQKRLSREDSPGIRHISSKVTRCQMARRQATSTGSLHGVEGKNIAVHIHIDCAGLRFVAQMSFEERKCNFDGERPVATWFNQNRRCSQKVDIKISLTFVTQPMIIFLSGSSSRLSSTSPLLRSPSHCSFTTRYGEHFRKAFSLHVHRCPFSAVPLSIGGLDWSSELFETSTGTSLLEHAFFFSGVPFI